MNLQIGQTEWADTGITLTLKGELDLYSAAQLRQKIIDSVEEGRNVIIANLQEVGYLDSTGLGVLIGALRRAREQGGDMVPVASHPRLTQVLDITGLGKIFRVFADEQSAREAIEA